MLTLLTFVKGVRAAHAEMIASGVEAEYAKAVTVFVALWVNRLTDFNSSLCVLKAGGGRGIVHTFGRQALPMVWDFAEGNPLGSASANAELALEYTIESVKTLLKAQGQPAIVARGSATELPFGQIVLDAIVTDPPYYDNVSYADLSDYFYVWMKRSIGSLFSDHFSMEITPKKKEAIAAPYRHGDNRDASRNFYENAMAQAFMEAHRILKPDGSIVTVYAHKTTAGWSTLIDSMRRSGFCVTEAWPLDTENASRMLAQDTAALASSIFLVARKRENGATGHFVRDVLPDMQRIVRERVRFFLAQGITGADLNIATVGAGLAPFTRYARVELPNGEELTAAKYLEEVQGEVVRVLLGEAGRADPATRFYIMARSYYGAAAVDFDEANTLARATGVELDSGPAALTRGKLALVEKKGAKVRLRDYSERGMHEELGLSGLVTPQPPPPSPSQGRRGIFPSLEGDGAGVRGFRAPLVDVLHRLLWLAENENRRIDEFLGQAMPEKYLLRVVAQSLAGRALAAEPTPGAVRDERTSEQRAIDTLLAAWRRIVDEGRMV